MLIRPIRNSEELAEVHKEANKDGSHLFWPTHSVKRDTGTIIGALSLMPAVILWSAKSMNVRESMQIRDFYEGLLSNQSRAICIPCPLDSAYLKVLKKQNLAHVSAGQVELFFKGV